MSPSETEIASPSRPTQRLLDWASQNPARAATLLGGLAYVAVIASYRGALRPFGLTPADVGIGYLDAVWPILGIASYLAVLATFPLLFLRTISSKLFDRALGSRKTWIWMAVLLVAIPSAVAWYEEGEYIKNVRAGQQFDLPLERLRVLFALRATAVTMAWKSESSAPVLPSQPVLLLGSANGVAVIYDSVRNSTIRVPLGDIILTSTLIPAGRTR